MTCNNRAPKIRFCALVCLMSLSVGLLLLVACAPRPGVSDRQPLAAATCPARPSVGSVVDDPPELHSLRGTLTVELQFRKSVDSDGQVHFCYLTPDGREAPTLRLNPGDWLILHLRNEESAASMDAGHPHEHVTETGCTAATMDVGSTNLHFHGLSIPPTCHQDDVLSTLIQPGDKPYEYRIRIPDDQPPGLYWYHPHVHGMTNAQVLGGASGALIVDGIERANASLLGLPERVFIIRDRELLNPHAIPDPASASPQAVIRQDTDGDSLNTGNGTGKPAKDLSINFVTVPYPHYTPAVVRVRPGELQLWRILNASAITYVDLQLLFGEQPQIMRIVSMDGTPINENGATYASAPTKSKYILVPPGGRIEIVVKTPPAGLGARLVTQAVNTGPAGDNDPARPLATVMGDATAPESTRLAATLSAPLAAPSVPWLHDVQPVRMRKLYFSEQHRDPKNPKSPIDYFLTVEGKQPKVFDPSSKTPDIVVHQGDVEDWIIENRTDELHAFHIHQIHFLLLDRNGRPVNEPFLRDTVNVDYWDGKRAHYPRVLLRMDFRDPNVVGTFVYHCHLLEHEDGGMMGVIQVEPRTPDQAPRH